MAPLGAPIISLVPGPDRDGPAYNLANSTFEWSARIPREPLVDGSRTDSASVRLKPPSGPAAPRTDGGAHGSVDAAGGRRGAHLVRDHQAQSAVPGRGLCPHSAGNPQAPRDRRARAGLDEED